MKFLPPRSKFSRKANGPRAKSFSGARFLSFRKSKVGNYNKVHVVNNSDVLALSEGLFLTWEDSVADDLALTQAAKIEFPESVSQDIALVDSITEVDSTARESILGLSSNIGVQFVFKDSISQPLNLVQGITVFVDRPGGGAQPCVDTYPHTISLKEVVVFTWDILTVTIRAPQFGNTDDLELGTLVRKNRGGDYKISKASSWPTIEILKMVFKDLSDTDRDDLVDFMSQSAGKEIGFKDHEGIDWLGVIITPVADVIQDIGQCATEIHIDFRGERS